MYLDYWPSNAADWHLEHFDVDGNMDALSPFTGLTDSISALNISQDGNFGVVCRDSAGNWLPTKYSDPIHLIDQNAYVFWFSDASIHVWE